ncbi:MAG: glycosyltransferase [Deltaproteobacteria bacterium]|nr:glycosyltransferase [Deltaproteobacteria bacterium]
MPVIIKQFRYPGLWRRLGFLFASSPAFGSMRGALLLQSNEIGTARPVAALEDRTWKNRGTSYYVAEEVKDSRSLSAFWRYALPELPPEERRLKKRLVLRKVADLFARLHSLGIYHRDLKGSNILIRGWDGDPCECFLIDVDGLRQRRRLGWSRRIKNLVQINCTLGRRLSQRDRIYFFRRYAESSLLPGERRKLLMRKIQALTWKAETRRMLRRVGSGNSSATGKVSVLFLVGGLPYGGIENLLLDLVAHLDRDRFEFRVINLSGSGALAKRFLQKSIDVVNLGFRLSTHRLDNTWRLRRLLKRIRPDVIFTCQFSANYLAAMGLPCKVITQVHNIKREPYWERRQADRLLGWIGTDRFVAVSRKVEEVLAAAVPASVGKTTLLYNALSLDRMRLPCGYSREAFRSKEGLDPNDFVIAAVGRLVYQKGFDILLEAFPEVIASVPAARLLIAGDGGMWGELKAIIERLSLAAKVRLLGYRDDIPSLLSASDLFVMPSRWEGFGIAALEALALGIPTIVTDTAPISELLTSGVNALVVPCDRRAIGQAIVDVAGDEAKRKLLAASGRSLLVQSTEMGAYARQMEALILQVSQKGV